MIEPDLSYERCLAKAQEAGQEHIFRWWDELDDAGRDKLLSQVRQIDFDRVSALADEYLDAEPEKFKGEIEPVEIITFPKTPEEASERRRVTKIGAEAIRRGEVAVFIVAGGQGSRLKYDPPKGTYPIYPITGKSLFEVFADKIKAVSRRYETTIPLCVMTSTVNNNATQEFFEVNDYFGLGRENVLFTVQETLPTLDLSGKMILKSKNEIFTNPNGHGGSIKALKDGGALDEFRRRGVKYISYHQVDNALVKSIDPTFLGYHIAEDAEMSLKVLQKRDAEEKLGVVGYVDGKMSVIEYSDLAPELMYARNEDGSLVYSAGSIAIHLFNLEFIERLNEGGLQLPWHVARKSVPHIDENGNLVKPDKPNGVKFETFVFDALPFATNAAIVETDRTEEFAPVKNAKGPDSPETAMQIITNCFGRWLRDAGVDVPVDAEGNVQGKIEINPQFAYDSEELASKIPPGTSFDGELLLDADDA